MNRAHPFVNLGMNEQGPPFLNLRMNGQGKLFLSLRMNGQGAPFLTPSMRYQLNQHVVVKTCEERMNPLLKCQQYSGYFHSMISVSYPFPPKGFCIEMYHDLLLALND